MMAWEFLLASSLQTSLSDGRRRRETCGGRRHGVKNKIQVVERQRKKSEARQTERKDKRRESP